MTNPTEPNKVVDLQSRQAQLNPTGLSERHSELLKSLRVHAMKRLGILVAGVFDGVDDALFDMAEKAENNSIQTRFFDGMREVRKKRPVMERQVQDNISRAFVEFVNPSRRVQDAKQEAGLSLVEEGELEESLAASSMAGKAENKSSRVLFALNQRMSALMNGAKVGDDENPIGPKNLIRAFQLTLKELEGEVQMIKLIILKLFDKQVIAQLDPLYEEFNQQLVDGGLLPQLKATPSVRRTPSGGAATASSAPTSDTDADPNLGYAQMPQGPVSGGMGPEGGYAQGNASVESMMQLEMFNSLRSLLAARHSGYGNTQAGPAQGQMHAHMGGQMQQNYPMGQTYAPMVPQGPTLSASDLLNALSILQNQVMQPQVGGQSHGQSYGFAMPSLQAVSQVKGELLQQAERLGGQDHKVTAADEDTIDLVGMLFEFILQDKNLPPEIQAQLARLQIPYLKVAILDKHLFAKKDHPARRLLDEMAQAGVGWSEESDRDRRLIERIRQIVENLLKDFDDDTGIFDREYQNFVEFFAGLKKRADVAEARTTEAAHGREKLQSARKTAAKEILIRMEDKPVPEVIRHLLTRPWANVLVLTSLRQGEGSHQWQASLRVADELIWSAQRKETDEDRSRLRALIPELEKALRQGLSLVAYQEADVAHLISELHKLYGVLLEPPAERVVDNNSLDLSDFDDDAIPMDAKPVFVPPPASANDDTNFVDEIVLGVKGEEDHDEEEMVDDEYVEVARGIKVGTWVEFREANGHVERAKLSWISPISAKYLFVNRKGLKVGDKTVWGLAAELRLGTAEVLEDVPLFDRALDAIVERLKTGVAPVEEVAEEMATTAVPEGSIGESN
jgi:Protein of unknown function (DUF1631)